MRNALCTALACLALAACSTTQQTAAVTYAADACAAYNAAATLDPTFAKHNPQLAADVSAACAVAPVVITAVTTPPASTTPATP